MITKHLMKSNNDLETSHEKKRTFANEIPRATTTFATGSKSPLLSNGHRTVLQLVLGLHPLFQLQLRNCRSCNRTTISNKRRGVFTQLKIVKEPSLTSGQNPTSATMCSWFFVSHRDKLRIKLSALSRKMTRVSIFCWTLVPLDCVGNENLKPFIFQDVWSYGS